MVGFQIGSTLPTPISEYGNYKFTGASGSASYLNSKHGASVTGATYANAMPSTAWVNTSGDMGNGGNNLRAGVVVSKPATTEKKWEEYV